MPGPIPTSHAGSLPRPEDLVELNLKRTEGQPVDEADYQQRLAQAVRDVVARQDQIGIDWVNDGEYGHSMGHRYDYGSWWTYVFQRLGGLEIVPRTLMTMAQPAAKPGEIGLATFAERRDWNLFAEAYSDPTSGVALPTPPEIAPVATGPITYIGQADIQRDIENFKAALDAAGLEDGYLNSVAPGSCHRFGNEFYDNDEEMMYACADAHARGVQGDHRRRPGPPARRPRDRRELGPDRARSRASRTTSASRWSGSRRSTTRSATSPPSASASTSAGEAGTARTSRTSR